MIKSLIQLHQSFFKYLIAESKIKKELKDIPKVIIGVIKLYVTAIKKLITQECDKDYKIKKKQYETNQKTLQEVRKVVKLWKYVSHELLIKMGKNKKERQQIRTDFFENGQLNKEVFAQLAKEIGEK